MAKEEKEISSEMKNLMNAFVSICDSFDIDVNGDGAEQVENMQILGIAAGLPDDFIDQSLGIDEDSDDDETVSEDQTSE